MMIDKEKLHDNEIWDWKDINEDYKFPNLLLGNGFSIKFSQKFGYTSLFDKFIEICDPPFDKLFRVYETSNFELILKNLIYGKRANQVLKLDTDQIGEGIDELKQGLITTIKNIHPENKDISSVIEKMAHHLIGFNNIFTINYDLILYHIIMKTVDLEKKNSGIYKYKDGFWNDGELEGFTTFDHSSNLGSRKIVYYLHGALFLYKIWNKNVKLNVKFSPENLIEKVSELIKKGCFPLFVAGGSSEEKIEQIYQDRYLRFCYEQLKKSQNSLVVFGSRLYEGYDNHIFEAITHHPKKIVYSIYCNGRSIDDILEEKHGFAKRFDPKVYPVQFIDSESLFH